MARNKDRRPPEDDGRTIARMNVEGMPWYTPTPDEDRPEPATPPEPMDREDRRHYILGAVAAALAVGGVFALVLLLFILFCVFVWFK